MLKGLLNLLFPRSCPGCDRPVNPVEGAVCLECLLDMPETRFHERPRDNALYFKLAGRVPLEAAAALYYFDKNGRLKRVVSSLKYRRNPHVGRDLGAYYGEMLQGIPWLENASAIVPVPLHPRRLAERGYNQSAALGKGLSKQLGIPLLENSLVRKTNTRTQTKKGKFERWENVASAFECRGTLPDHVVLVDDVITTGATTEACIRALQAEREVKVSLLALAMAR